MMEIAPARDSTPAPESSTQEWKVGLNRWQYWGVLALTILFHGGWQIWFEGFYGWLISAAIVLLATLARLRNLGRSAFSFATLAQVIGGIVMLQFFSGLISRWVGQILAACALVVLLPCLYLPPKYEIYPRMDRAGYLLILLLLLFAGCFTYWCYR